MGCRRPNRIVYFGDDIIILLEHKGYDVPCFISAVDYPLVKDYRWSVAKKGKTFYARSSSARVHMHALIFGAKNADHKDRDSLNNRRDNLRTASPSQSICNRGPRDNKTGFKGVHPRYDKFFAVIKVDGKRRYLGSFNTAVEAARAYNKMAKELHGDYAVLNELPEDRHELILNQGQGVTS